MTAAVLDPPVTDIGSLLEVREGYRQGRPCLKGTGVTVHTIAAHHFQGMNAQEIWEGFPHTSLASVYAALAYYFANKEQVDGDLDADEEEGERLIAEQTERLRRERKAG